MPCDSDTANVERDAFTVAAAVLSTTAIVSSSVNDSPVELSVKVTEKE